MAGVELVTFLLYVLHVTSAQLNPYPTLAEVSGTIDLAAPPGRFIPDDVPCNVRNSCLARSNDQLELYAKNCFCDDLCLTFNDCCQDYRRYVKRNRITPIKLNIRKSSWKCVKMSRIDPEHELAIIDKCPNRFPDREVRERCADGGREDGISDIPVVGINTGILFRNLYCAICSGEENYTFLTVSLECSGPESPDVININITQALAFPSEWCSIRYRLPGDARPRSCKSGVLDTCSDDWRDGKVRKRCESYAAYVYYGNIAIRNRACAACLNVNNTALTCEDMYTPRLDGTDFAGPRSYRILFDVGSAKRTVVSSLGEESASMQYEQCDSDQVYNIFRERCQPVYCPPGTHFRHGECAKLPDRLSVTIDNSHEDAYSSTDMMTISPSSRSPLINDRNSLHRKPATDVERSSPAHEAYMRLQCPLLELTDGDYILLSNGSLYTLTMSKMYSQGEFYLTTRTLFICNPFNNTYIENQNGTIVAEMFAFDSVQSLVSTIGLVISMTGLVVHFVVYMMLAQLRNLPGQCTICLVVALFLAQGLFLSGTHQTDISEICFTLSATMHYCFLAAFFWMNVLSMDICRTFSSTFVSPRSNDSCCSKRFACYSAYAWLTPAAIVGLSIILDLIDIGDTYRPHYGEGLCWITNQRALLLLFALPIGVLLFLDVISFAVTVYYICVTDKDMRSMAPHGGNNRANRTRFLLYVKLAFIMGLTWLLGYLAMVADSDILWYAFIVFNTLQGLFICLAFCCTKKVFRMIREKGKGQPTSKHSRSRGSSSAIKTYSTYPTYVNNSQPHIVAHETSI